MLTKFTNLLSRDRQQATRRAYFVRLATVATLVIAALLTVHGLLRVPAYIYLKTECVAQQQTLAKLTAQLSTQDEQSTSARLNVLNSDTKFLATLAAAPSASDAVRVALSVPRKGITLFSMTYAAAAAGKPNTMTLTGTAQTRGSLQHYQMAFERASFITTTNLPVNAYAKDANIHFTITLTGTFTL